jgi:hypothetical protein
MMAFGITPIPLLKGPNPMTQPEGLKRILERPFSNAIREDKASAAALDMWESLAKQQKERTQVAIDIGISDHDMVQVEKLNALEREALAKRIQAQKEQ